MDNDNLKEDRDGTQLPSAHTDVLTAKLTKISELEKKHHIIGVGFTVEAGKENLTTGEVADHVIAFLEEAGDAFNDNAIPSAKDVMSEPAA